MGEIAVIRIHRRHIIIVIGVIVDERHLSVHVSTTVKLGRQFLHVALMQGYGALIHDTGERLVIQVESAVDNGHNHAFARLFHTVQIEHVERALILHGLRAVRTRLIIVRILVRELEFAADERVLNTIDLLDGFQSVRRSGNGKAVENVVVVVHILHGHVLIGGTGTGIAASLDFIAYLRLDGFVTFLGLSDFAGIVFGINRKAFVGKLHDNRDLLSVRRNLGRDRRILRICELRNA